MGRFKTFYEKKEKDRCFEIFHKPSITVPGMAQTVEEVFQTFRRGGKIEGKQIIFDENLNDYDEPGYDIIDAHQSINNIKANIETIKRTNLNKEQSDGVTKPINQEEVLPE